ncbi:MAG: Holliday junction resolvase RecU [Lactovum sp.]
MIHYPKGSKTKLNLKQKISNTNQKKLIKFGKRGMSFEADINASNEYYLAHKIALIHKKPTPIQIVRVDYPKRSRAKITEAYFRQASTTDYSGVYKGRYIDFEAKETSQKKSFPLKNFHSHQISHMKSVIEQDGIAFVLLHFSQRAETYYLSSSILIDFYEKNQGLKSIALSFIQEHGFLIPKQELPRIPYIKIINSQIGGDSNR